MIVNGRAHAYVPRKEGGFRISIPGFDTVGATSLFTTVEDLARWEANFLEPKVGDAKVMQQMLERARLTSGDELPYAFAIVHGKHRDRKTLEHSGGDAGYRAHYLRFPEQKLAVACLCGLSDSKPWDYTREVADVWLGASTSTTPGAPATPSGVGAAPAADLTGKVGYFWNETREEYSRFEVSDGKLFFGGGTPYELKPLGPHRFQISGAVELLFEGRRATVLLPEGEKPRVFEKVDPITLSEAQLQDYVGTYWSEELGVYYRVLVKDGKLVLRRRKSSDLPLTPFMADSFVNDDLRFLRFARGPGRRITGFGLSSGRIRRLRFVRQDTPPGAKAR
jgi:Beta-lactamase